VTLDRAAVLAALRAEDVVQHFGIVGQWRGRWLRSQRCAVADDHAAGSMPFGIAHDGKWHCWACDQGGDILKLIAVGEKLDMRNDFPRILEIAAAIAGVEDDESFGAVDRPPPKARAPLPPVPSLQERVAIARKRAAWVWDRLYKWDEVARTTEWGQPGRHSVADLYLGRERKLDPVVIRKLEELRETPMRITPEQACKSPELKSLSYLFAFPGIALPVRSVVDGALVDIRVRRYEPRADQPKIIGMLGGVTTGPAEGGRPRQLIGCYGNPHCIDPGPSRTVVVCEGALDYLTGLCVWPDAQILGAVDAGSLSLVAGLAARGLADYPGGRLLIVEQNDGIGAAADRSVNEDVNSASKRAIQILGPKRVGWLPCDAALTDPAINPMNAKDLNDLVRFGMDPTKMVRWWTDMESAA
jgi:hypothetical protein